MQEPHPDLDGRTPADVIVRDGDVERVRNVTLFLPTERTETP